MERVTGNAEKYPSSIFLFLSVGDSEKSFNHKIKDPLPNITREFHYFLQTKPYLPTVATICSAVVSTPLAQQRIALPAGAD